MQERMKSLEETKTTLERQIAFLNNETQEAKNNSKRLQEKLKLAQLEIERFSQSNEDSIEREKSLRAKCEHIEKKGQHLESDLDEFKMLNQALEQEQERLREEIKTLQKLHADLQEENQQLQEHLASDPIEEIRLQ